MSIPTSQKLYRFHKNESVDDLTLCTDEPVPQPKRGQVLVRIHATSLNYRDVMVAIGAYPKPYASGGVIPLSDGAGEIVQVGEDVSEFKVGDRVCGSFHQAWIDGEMKDEYLAHTLGGSAHGMLCQYRVFEVNGIVKMPSHLSYEEAATLPCAALTAWHALSQNGIQHVDSSSTVLILGTGGVAVFGIQFAVASGAKVIVLSSSDEKLEKVKNLGAHHLINYKTTPDWEVKVREITGGRGVDHVLEIGGSGTLERSIKSVKRYGQVHVIGFLAQPQTFDVSMSVLFSAAILRGIMVGSVGMFKNMNRAIENHNIHPVVDKVFTFDQAKEAYKYLQSQQHVGKVVIRVD